MRSQVWCFKRTHLPRLGLSGHFWSKVTEAHFTQAYAIYWEEAGHRLLGNRKSTKEPHGKACSFCLQNILFRHISNTLLEAIPPSLVPWPRPCHTAPGLLQHSPPSVPHLILPLPSNQLPDSFPEPHNTAAPRVHKPVMAPHRLQNKRMSAWDPELAAWLPAPTCGLAPRLTCAPLTLGNALFPPYPAHSRASFLRPQSEGVSSRGVPGPPGSCACRIAWHPGVSAAWPPAWMLRSRRAGASAARSPSPAPWLGVSRPSAGRRQSQEAGKIPAISYPAAPHRSPLSQALPLPESRHLSLGQGTAWGPGEPSCLFPAPRSGFESEDGRLEPGFEPLHSPATVATAFASARPEFPNLRNEPIFLFI